MQSTPADPLPPLLAPPPAATGPLAWLWPAFFLLLALAAICFHSPVTMVGGNELSWDRAVFAAANALTLTGFQSFAAAGRYQPAGQWMTFLLIVAGTQFALISAGVASVRILRLRHTASQVIAAAVTLQLLVLLVGSVFLAEPTRPLVGAFDAAAAFGNCGLTLGRLPSVASSQAQLILLPLAILGGLGLPVLLDITDWFRGHAYLARHSRSVLFLTAVAYLVGLTLLFVFRWVGAANGADSWRSALAAASVAAIDTRTAGIAFPFTQLLPTAATQWIAVGLMIVGACPAGTGGGLKLTTLRELGCGTRRVLGGQPAGRAFGFALLWVGLYGLTAALSLLLLVCCEPQLSGDRLLFLAVSATSNVGLSHDTVNLTGAGLYVLSGTMLLGRLTPIVLLLRMAQTDTQANLLVA